MIQSLAIIEFKKVVKIILKMTKYLFGSLNITPIYLHSSLKDGYRITYILNCNMYSTGLNFITYKTKKNE